MSSAGYEDQPSPKELEERIQRHLLSAFDILSSLNRNVSLYLFYHNRNVRRDPFGENGLDEAYTMYEGQANECRRQWMKLRSASEKRAPLTKAADNPSPSGSRLDLETLLSPVESLSAAIDEDEPVGTQRNDRVTPTDFDPVQVEHIPRSPTPATDRRPPKPKAEKVDIPVPRGIIITPSGPTACRLAPIPKGVKLSVETTRIPAPRKPFTFHMPQRLTVNNSERRPLNRTKHNHQDLNSSKDIPSSSQSSSQQAGPSTSQTSEPMSPRRNYSSAKEYWEPRRAIRPGDFKMDKDRLFNSLDCLGPPFEVDMTKITHNDIPAMQVDLRNIYGGKLSLTPKISPEKLANHGFDHWFTPNSDFHPFLPARPGWPGLMLRSDDELEEWSPEGGTEFRVVIKRDPRFVEYVGQYEMVRLGDITGDEWKQQPVKVKKKWTQVLGGGQSWNDVIARVALRKKLNKEPTIEDLAKFTERFAPDSYATLAKELRDEVDRAFCKGEEVIAVWGMKCVDYDFKFEKHLARSLKTAKSSSSLSGSAKKRKAVIREDDAMDEAEDEERGEDSGSDEPSPSKRQRIAKGKAKLMKYDWTDAQFKGDSEDDDYKPT